MGKLFTIFRNSASAVAIAGSVMATTSIPASADNIHFDTRRGCLKTDFLSLCFGTGIHNRGGYGRGHGSPNSYKKEVIDRVPNGSPCPPGTDSEGVTGSTYSGTYRKTKICFNHVPKY